MQLATGIYAHPDRKTPPLLRGSTSETASEVILFVFVAPSKTVGVFATKPNKCLFCLRMPVLKKSPSLFPALQPRIARARDAQTKGRSTQQAAQHDLVQWRRDGSFAFPAAIALTQLVRFVNKEQQKMSFLSVTIPSASTDAVALSQLFNNFRKFN